jgi:hypothetical protein
MNEYETIRYSVTDEPAPRFRSPTPWMQLAAARAERRASSLPRIQLRGDRRMLRALRAAEMAAWERPQRSLFRLRAADARSV